MPSAAAPPCATAACCSRHPRLPACLKPRASPAPPLALPARSLDERVSLLLSAPVAAYVPPWYVRAAVRNWLRFTVGATTVVLHMDRARHANFTDRAPLDVEWRWLREGAAGERVRINPLRLYTYRRSGTLLAAHVHNFVHARRALSERPPTHVLFLA